MSTEKKHNPLEALLLLSKNAETYFEALFTQHKENMKCAAGCSKCCEVELTVVEAEAVSIVDWFFGLPSEKRANLVELWKNAFKDEHFKKSCRFLVDKKCTVYEARPIICRTQGAPLKFKIESDEFGVDACPLNFEKENTFPKPHEWLDLDRLNTLLAIANQNFKQHAESSRIAHLIDSNSRISLADVQNFLLDQSS